MFDIGSVKTAPLSTETALTMVKTRYDGAYSFKADNNLAAKILRADELASRHLGNANAAEEAGDYRKAERLYAKAQYWLDRYNRLVGNA